MFQVDMSNSNCDGGFDSVTVAGAGAKLTGFGAGLKMNQVGTSGIYALTVADLDSGEVNFKYRFHKNGNTNWEGGDNRILPLTKNDTTKITCFGSRVVGNCASKPAPSKITFIVDFTSPTAPPPASKIFLIGDFTKPQWQDGAKEMTQVVGNVKDGERFGYIQSPDAVSGDQNIFIRQLRELIHWTLGGVDPLGISASATFGEIKSLFGRIENTAMRKADILLGDKGLCKLLSKILLVEERKCKVAITSFIVEQFLNGDATASELVKETLTDNLFRNIYFYLTQEIGLELPGLPPLGQRDCTWRYTKDVFQRTTREMLDASIVYRNEREDGISQEIALSKLYPNMRDDEIRNSMSGFSPRVVTSALEGIGASLQLYTQFMQLPDPQNPQIPWAVSLGLDKLVAQGVLTLQKEITYNQPEYKDSPDFDQINAEINQTLTQLRTLSNVRTTTNPVLAASNVASSSTDR
jgi:hypothetical protein